jgi:hypothetical protein
VTTFEPGLNKTVTPITVLGDGATDFDGRFSLDEITFLGSQKRVAFITGGNGGIVIGIAKGFASAPPRWL